MPGIKGDLIKKGIYVLVVALQNLKEGLLVIKQNPRHSQPFVICPRLGEQITEFI